MPNNEKNAEPAVRDAQSTAARRRRRRHTPHGDAPAQNPAPRAPQPKDASPHKKIKARIVTLFFL